MSPARTSPYAPAMTNSLRLLCLMLSSLAITACGGSDSGTSEIDQNTEESDARAGYFHEAESAKLNPQLAKFNAAWTKYVQTGNLCNKEAQRLFVWGRFAACFCAVSPSGDSGDHQRYDRRAIGRERARRRLSRGLRPAGRGFRARPRQAESGLATRPRWLDHVRQRSSLHPQDSSSTPTQPACRASNLSISSSRLSRKAATSRQI